MIRVARYLAAVTLAAGLVAVPLAGVPASAAAAGVKDQLVTVVVKDTASGNNVSVSPNVDFPVAIAACNNNINVSVLTAIDQGNKGPVLCWSNQPAKQETWVQQN